MICREDSELRGHAMLFDGPMELLKQARKAQEAMGDDYTISAKSRWPGRIATTWEELEKFISQPWPQATQLVKKISDAIQAAKLPVPKDVRRKGRWSDTDGDIDIDRTMRGDPEYMREFRRQKVTGPTQICLINNLEKAAFSPTNPSGVFFRSACCIAIADMLEGLGYSTEIICWTLGQYVFPNPNHKQFTVCTPKKYGEPIDIDALCDTMSSWFTTTAVFGSFWANPVKPESVGCATYPSKTATEVEEAGLQGWEKYLDIQQGVLAVCIPMISGSADTAISVARTVLEKIIEMQG